MHAAYPVCENLVKLCYDDPNRFVCLAAASYCNNKLIAPYMATGRNVYDVRKDCGDAQLCYDIIPMIEKYLNKKSVKKQLGIPKKTEFESCNMQLNMKFSLAGDYTKPYHRLVTEVLASGVRVLIYAGDADYICK